MRLIQRSGFGFIFGGALAITGGLAGAACSGSDFNGCAAARDCGSPAAGSGGLSSAGHGGESAGGKAGLGGAGGVAGNASGGKGAKAGTGGQGDAGSPNDDAGASDAHESSGSGGTSTGSMSHGGTGGTEAVKPGGTGGSENNTAAGDAGMAGEPAEPGRDTKAPKLVMVTTAGSNSPWPDTGAKGVKDDDVIVVVFDEPMDPSTTGYSSTDLPPDAVQFTWDDTKTRLSIKPLAPLKYAEVSDPATSGQQYVFIVGKGFHDASGNALASSQTIVFTTLRHVTHSLPVTPGGGTVITQPASGTNTTSVRCESANDHVTAGMGASKEAAFSVVTFNLSSLPDGIQWNSASLVGALDSTVVIPFGDSRFGALHAYSTSVTPGAATWDSVETDLGPFAKYASTTNGAVDATSAISYDYRNRATLRNVSEYEFRFERQTETDKVSSDQFAYIYCDSLELELDYIAP